MYLAKQPEDSILRRHFEANVEMKRQMWLRKPPSDSTLRRHAMSAASVPADTPTRRAAADKKGLFPWLFGRFIRRT